MEVVLKWLLNDNVVYWWVPPQIPQVMGILKDKLDVGYRATDDPKTAYRAMKILNPTTDISGEYKCVVSTFLNEDFSVRNMTVFGINSTCRITIKLFRFILEPESSLMIEKGHPLNSYVNFTCFALNAFPEPKLFLYSDTATDSKMYVGPLLYLK